MGNGGCSKVLPESSEAKEGGALFVGSIDFLVDSSIVKDNQINCLVSCVPEATDELSNFVKANNMHHLLFPLEDSAEHSTTLFNSDPGIHEVAKFIFEHRKKGCRILVHCDAGVSRSPVVLAGYLMLYGTDIENPGELSFEAAKTIVFKHRPNSEFRQYYSDLQELERRQLNKQ